MANVEYVPVEEMLPRRARRQVSRRKQVQAEYDAYLAALQPDQAGKLTLEKGEKASLVRDRLRSAAKRAGVKLQLRRRGGTVYFGLRTSETPAATEKADAVESPSGDGQAPVAAEHRASAVPS